jgi:DNA-binding transcriptional regulator LsrR (DeoR family)
MTRNIRTLKKAANRAYVLIKTEPEKADEIAGELHRRFGIATVDIVDGPYEIIAVVEDSGIAAMAKTIAVDIRALAGVKDIIVYMKKQKEPVVEKDA